MEKKLNQVAQQIQEIHQQNELNAIDLNYLEGEGNVYVADSGNHRIEKFERDLN